MVISLFPAPVQRYNDAVGKAPASQTAGHSAQGLSPSSDRYGPTSFGSDRHVSLWSGHLTQGLNPSSHRYGLASFGSDHHVSLSTQGLSPSSHRYGFHKLLVQTTMCHCGPASSLKVLSPSSHRYGLTNFGSDHYVSLCSGHLTQGQWSV